MDYSSAWRRAVALYAQVGYRVDTLLRVRVEWSRRLTNSAGSCAKMVDRSQRRRSGDTYRIKLSVPVLGGVAEAEREKAIEDTLIHELAHAFAGYHWCGSKRANIFLPGITWLMPYSGLREPAFDADRGRVPFPWDLLRLGERVGYQRGNEWVSGILENFGPTRARIRFPNGNYRLVPYGWIC